MTTFNRLTVPSFDLTWLELLDGEAPVVLIPGGGGSTKSGIFNQIQIAAFDGKVGFKLLKSHMTDEEGKSNFCSAVSSGSLGGKPIVCAVIDDTCQLLVARRVEGEVILVKKTEFKADFNTEFASVNCCFIGSQHVITGGEDGVCRLWKINIQEGNEDEEDIWSVTGVRDMRGHTAPIMSISRHPINPWIITASKDGSCKIFDVSNGQGKSPRTSLLY
jgi:WD40 repeat protein